MKFEQRGVASQALEWEKMAWTRRQRSIVAAHRIQRYPTHAKGKLHSSTSKTKPWKTRHTRSPYPAQVATLSWRQMLCWCSTEKPSSSKAVSQKSVFKSWGFWHKPMSCTLHVSILLAKVAAAYTPQTGNIEIVLLREIKGQMHLHVHASSRNCWLLRADKSQGAHGSLPVTSCNYLMLPKSWNKFMAPRSSCTSSDWNVFRDKASDGRRVPSSVCCSTECGVEKDVCGRCSRSRANARSIFYNKASITICQLGNNPWFKITPHPHIFFFHSRENVYKKYIWPHLRREFVIVTKTLRCLSVRYVV